MSERTEQPVVFTPPASVKSAPDIVLQSSDGALCLAHKTYLAAASPVFEGMFSLGENPRNARGEDPPVVPLSESADVLVTLLSIIYPVRRTRPTSFKILEGAIFAAEKYELVFAIDALRPYLTWPPFLKSSPLAIYALSCGLDFDLEKRLAMEQLYELDQKQLLSQDVERVPSRVLMDILNARRTRADVIIEIVVSILKVGSFKIPRCTASQSMPEWMDLWKDLVQLQVRDRPIIGSSFSADSLNLAKRRAGVCSGCGTANCSTWDSDGFGEFVKHMQATYASKVSYE